MKIISFVSSLFRRRRVMPSPEPITYSMTEISKMAKSKKVAKKPAKKK